MLKTQIKKSKFVFTIILSLNTYMVSAQMLETKTFDFSYLDRKITGWVDSGFYNGAAILIAKNNVVVHEKYFGSYNPSTVAYIASAGKWLAAATIAAVVEEGKLSWNDPVRKWIPEIRDAKGDATLLQLLSHTAGYPDYQPKNLLSDHYQSLEESVLHLVNLAPDTLPGTKFKYGGLAMQVAGRMAELATGKLWEQIFQEKIAIPLHMKSTHFTPVDSTPGHSPMLGGGARTSLLDYSNFLQMIANNGIFDHKRILSLKSINEMQWDQVKSAEVGKDEFVEMVSADRRKDIYGLGEWREEVDRRGNALLISSPSWAGAYPWIDKKNKIYGFFLARVEQMKEGFNSFFASPVLPLLVRDVIDQQRIPAANKGYAVMPDKSNLYYEQIGKGENLIFIHGHSLDRRSWDKQFYEFAKKYHVIRYDVRGYGWSSMPSEQQKMMHADDLASLMNQLGIKKAHIVGLSLGGFILSDFMALYPERIQSATIASADFFNVNGPSVPWTKPQWDQQSIMIKDWQQMGVMSMKIAWFNALTVRKGITIEALRKPVWSMIYKWDAWQPQHHEPRFLLGSDLKAMLAKTKLDFPIMMMTGSEDQNENQLKKAIPLAIQITVAKAGHLINMENPSAFNRELSSFLKGNLRK